jgi:hypothetical protein
MALLSIPEDISMERLKALQQILLLREDAIPELLEEIEQLRKFSDWKTTLILSGMDEKEINRRLLFAEVGTSYLGEPFVYTRNKDE